MRIEPPHHSRRQDAFHTDEKEKASALAFLPLLGIIAYYVLLPHSQEEWALFFPQILGYLGLGLWCAVNGNRVGRLGLAPVLIAQGIRWGLATGLVLGFVNVIVILRVVPWIGGDIRFLADTPHARAPMWVMLPWAIVLIALFVEVNFRGFILGRVLVWAEQILSRRDHQGSLPLRIVQALAVAASAWMFAFDPFMVSTFRHLHWIAIWDGLVWGTLWAFQRNLYTVITAHAVEVMVMYSIIKLTLGN